ncbi:MAG: FtsX-like permease family protein [Candidatus Heimdallarchaeota archaeon]|nr:FtsX-like permease family protein [Candidatus Heimdallarchaeota archaeon]
MSYITNLFQKTFKRRLGKNIGTLIAISLGVSLMVGVQITITSFSTEALKFFADAIGENDIIISGFGFPIQDYEGIIDQIYASDIEFAAINARVTQDVAVYNLETGDLEKGVSFVGVELDEDPVFGQFHFENETKISQVQLSDIFSNESHVLLGSDLQEDLNVTVGSIIKIRIGELNQTGTLRYEYKTYDLKVVDFLSDLGKGKELGGRALWTSIDNIRSILGLDPDVCTDINIALSANHEENPVDNEYAKQVELELKELLDPTGSNGLIIIAFRALILEVSEEILADVLIAFNLFGALIIFAGVLLLVNIQLIQVEDRIQQLGILRAIGSKRREIVQLFLIESTVLGIFGSFMGVAGGYGMSVFLVYQIGQTFFEGAIILQPTVTSGAVIYSIVLGLILSVGAGVFPAIRAARVDVIEVIRGIKKVKPKRTGTFSLGLGLTFIVGGIGIFVSQYLLYGSFFVPEGWDTSLEQWMFMGASAAVLIGVSIILGYLFSKKIMGNGIGLTFMGVAIVMLLTSLPALKEVTENTKILATLAVVLALGSIIVVGVNLSAVTNSLRNMLYRTRLKKGVSLISSKYMTSKSIRSTLTFGIFALVLTMNIFAGIYQSTYSYNTLESAEFFSGGAPIFIELDTPIANSSLVEVEKDLYSVDEAITYVKGINSTIIYITQVEGYEFEIPSEILPAGVDMIYEDTFKNGSDYTFDFIFEQSISQFTKKYKPGASEEYQREYSHEIWDFFYNRTKFNAEGYVDNDNGFETVISTTPLLRPGFVFNLHGLGYSPRQVIVIASVMQYPFAFESRLPSLIITPDFYPILRDNFVLYPKYTRFLVQTSLNFRTDENYELAERIEEYFNGNESLLVLSEDFVAADADSYWNEMLQLVDFQVKTFAFLEYFVGFGLVVGALGMIIIAVRNVSERRREIGMMRAIGFKKRQIIGSIMLELFILAILGLVMGFINSLILGWSFSNIYDWRLVIPLLKLLLYTGIMLGIALIASIIPGIRASQITPAEAIRYVG